MKKYFVLTSVLALAACGGGGHGALSPEASNRKVTGMATYIRTDAAGNTLESRTAGTRHAGEYDLSDVNFLLTDEGFGGKFEFDVNEDKKIVGIKILADEEDPEDHDLYFERKGNTNEFYDKIGQINVGNDEETHENIYKKGKFVYNSFGNSQGLRYSDFGNANVFVLDEESGKYIPAQTFVFIGGYDGAKIIQESDIAENMHFTGKATGSVVPIRGGEGSGEDKTMNLDADATLDFATATKESVLNANFDNWYRVRYVKNDSGESITFDEYKNDDPDYKLITGGGAASVTINAPTDNTTARLETEMRYFGDGNNPSEAVGMIQLRDKGIYAGAPEDSPYTDEHINNYGPDAEHAIPEVRMNLSFGVN